MFNDDNTTRSVHHLAADGGNQTHIHSLDAGYDGCKRRKKVCEDKDYHSDAKDKHAIRYQLCGHSNHQQQPVTDQPGQWKDDEAESEVEGKPGVHDLRKTRFILPGVILGYVLDKCRSCAEVKQSQRHRECPDNCPNSSVCIVADIADDVREKHEIRQELDKKPHTVGQGIPCNLPGYVHWGWGFLGGGRPVIAQGS